MSYSPKTSDAAVKKATGKMWSQWFALLDKAGAKKMAHIDIARLLYKKYLGGDKQKDLSPDVAKSGGWWSQMVTVEYERTRGLRAVNQTATGYNVSVHGTFPVSLPKLFAAWRKVADVEGLEEKSVKENKPKGTATIRYKRDTGKPFYVVMFMAKNKNSSRVGFEAMRLAKSAEIETQRAKWKKVLEKLRKSLL